MKEKIWDLICERYAPEQTYLYLRDDPVYQEKEKELKEAVAAFDPVIHALGNENWLKYDRILTAHNSCEAYALQRIYLKGIQDALEMHDAANREEKNGGE